MNSFHEQLFEKLKFLNAQLATAESCTGGLIAKLITDLPGSSAVFWGSAVCYDNSAKTTLVGVDSDLIRAHGAVSEPVARAMALGILGRMNWQKSHAHHFSISTTGVAGPTGGTPHHPLGSVWIGVALHSQTEKESGAQPRFYSRHLQSDHPADRRQNRALFANSALQLLLEVS